MASGVETETGETVDLTEEEEREVASLGAPRAAVVFETVRREGETELRRSALSLALSGLAAGLSMGLSLAGIGLARAYLPPNAAWTPLVASLGYTLGFLVVVLGRQQLFTENTLTVILPFLDSGRKLHNLGRIARLWAIVLAANIAGAFLFAFATSHFPIFDDDVRGQFIGIGLEAAKPDFGTIVWRGIAAGWLVALMVWMLPGADALRMLVIIIVTYAVALGGFSHIIAGSVEVLYLVNVGLESWHDYLLDYLLPVFIGNSIGGISLVALLNYGQVAAEERI